MSVDKRISKSRANIHYQLAPDTKLTTTAVKALYVFTYFIQNFAKKYDSTAAFNSAYGTGNIEISIPKYMLFKYTVGATAGDKVGSRNYKILTEVFEELKDLSITWDNKEEEGKEHRGFHRLFPGIEEFQGDVIFTVPSRVRQFFVNDSPVAVIDWVRINENISSRYGIFLNEVVEEKMYGSTENSASLNFSDDELRNALKIQYTLDSSTQTKIYSNPTRSSLKAKVLKPAIDQYNKAELNFELSNLEFSKTDNVWYLDVHRRETQVISRIAADYPDEFLRIYDFLTRIKLSKVAKEKLVSRLTVEKEVRYILYLIDIMEENTEQIKKSISGYFMGCYEANRADFEMRWKEIQSKQLRDIEKQKLDAIANIQLQNETFRKQYKENQYKKYIDDVLIGKIKSSEYLEQYKAFLKKSLMISSFKQEFEDLTSNQSINPESMPFRGFVTEQVKIDEKECAKFISNQTKRIKLL